MTIIYHLLLFTSILLFASCTEIEMSDKGMFSASTVIGEAAATGSASFDSNLQIFTLSGTGYGFSEGAESFQYIHKNQPGNFLLRARIDDFGNESTQTGWSVRKSLDKGSAHVSAVVDAEGNAFLAYRGQDGAETDRIPLNVTGAAIIQLERIGDKFIMSAAMFGEPFRNRESVEVSLDQDVYVGLFASNGEVQFSNVRVTIPVDEDHTPYQEYIGSRVEILNVDTGHLEVVHQENRSLQAPNWTIDGKSLIYNADGLLYNFDLETRTPTEIYSDFATRNNNDHVISFSGELLGISHHSEDHNGQSIVYVMPIEGGTPTLVTDLGPSYLHGWSAGDDTLTYTGLRNGQYDIYKISIDGGEEVQLTDTPGLDDGSEYTPDGKYIYFNSERTDTMQIWRMRPDGSEQEQLTFDEYQDWFPHISPDGKTVVFLSYMPDIPSGDHPFYKHVYLRKMPLDGGEPEVIAYLYGGQGTINVPSWSPDSRYISFVSNTQMED